MDAEEQTREDPDVPQARFRPSDDEGDNGTSNSGGSPPSRPARKPAHVIINVDNTTHGHHGRRYTCTVQGPSGRIRRRVSAPTPSSRPQTRARDEEIRGMNFYPRRLGRKSSGAAVGAGGPDLANMVFKVVGASESESESAAESIRLLDEPDDDDCPMCLEPSVPGEGNVSTCKPCGHDFHTECMFQFFSKCFVWECPMCRTTIQALEKDNGVVLSTDDLKKNFRQNCYDIRFRTEPLHRNNSPYGAEDSDIISFYTAPEQIRSLTVQCATDSTGSTVHKVRIPTIVLELLDSDERHQSEHDQDIVISVQHSSPNGTVTPDTVMMTNGIAVFDYIDYECKAEDHNRSVLLAIKFMVQAPGSLCHHKAVYAGLNLKHPFTCSPTHLMARILWCLIALAIIVLVIGLYFSGAL